MHSLTALILLRGSSGPYDYWVLLGLFVFSLLFSIIKNYWPSLRMRFDGLGGRNWPTVSALIDIVTVVEETVQGKYGERTTGYTAVLTYFYRNPELQTGEYRRLFDGHAEAQSWANSYKDRTVLVHVDPHDPTRSVLREDEL